MMKIAPILKAMIGEMLNSTQTRRKNEDILLFFVLLLCLFECMNEIEGKKRVVIF